ncbi:hypothetical protein Syun_028729 [Stephania yunnanensis]|uniref:3'-5' exonuclease domain-containing protein n=1 Tax=Stephania yunnanensis TaxID=152371 RepID=A0AAP0E440_9MAGN
MLKEGVGMAQDDEAGLCQTHAICLHAFSDLSHTLPTVFMYLLKECYVHGTRKATAKFRTLQQQVMQALCNSPKPGPATFIMQSLFVFPVLEAPYSEGFSHLVISALRRFLKVQTMYGYEDFVAARLMAARLFLYSIDGIMIYEEGVLIKLLEVVDVKLKDIEQAMSSVEVTDDNFKAAKARVELYISRLIQSQSYMLAVSFLEQFSIQNCDESLLNRMIQENQFKAAEKWASFVGKPMLCMLIKKYVELKMLTNAYDIIKKNDLKQEFPDVYDICKESSLRKLAEKGCWDVAEERTHNDIKFVEYLVYMAMEAGYNEKVDELCDRYSLKGFAATKGPESNVSRTPYLDLNELIVEDIIWVDDVDGLLSATSHIEECKVVGIDCEWKPNYEKGSKPNKVSIMQIASEKKVFILDLIKLSQDYPNVLDSCLTRVLHSSSVLKLGYNLQCDLKQLAHSYDEMQCFKHYEMLLDIQNVFKEPKGGLSGLAKKILGAGLNKTRRNSNWEQRPLTQNQMEYAALDAAVLVHIFHHVRDQQNTASINDDDGKVEWKSYIVSHMDNNIKKGKTRKKYKSKRVHDKEAKVPVDSN